MNIKTVDLRSDTITLPSKEMRAAMARAEVGDDVYGEDPTVNLLESEAAALVGKEAALFVSSGTMGNLIAILTHTSRGDAVLLDPEAHIFYYEAGGASLIGGVQLWPVTNLHSYEGIDNLKKALRPPDQHFAPAALLCLENTHNRNGGTILKPEEQDKYYEIACKAKIPLHLDGARIFNAALALNCPVTDLTRSCDSIMFCLSKGLGAPVGSILAGSSSFIERARRYRKVLGGGMRQAGILAAAGLIALKNIPYLSEDHRRARILAEGITSRTIFRVTPSPPPTNMVIINTEPLSSAEFLSRLESYGVKSIAFGENRVRMVTHLDISDEGIDWALEAIERLSREVK
ncbi:MAG: low-specificity L-threonine aldolase [Firmicutes bacterium]|jgi:threonine aldolase|nr:low-specificity L-threonine aldolase [Bacillota bacterium]